MECKVQDMVNAVTRKVNSSYGHITRTTLPAMDNRMAAVVDRTTDVVERTTALATHLDVLEACITAHQTPSTAKSPTKTDRLREATPPRPTADRATTMVDGNNDKAHGNDDGDDDKDYGNDDKGQPSDIMTNTCRAFAAFGEHNSYGSADCCSPAPSN